MGLNVEELKAKVLDLAVRGKLVPQDETEGTANDLLKQIKIEKDRLFQEKKIKKQEPLVPITEDEIPFEIPENWFWARLGYVTSYGNNKTIEPLKIDSTTWVLELEDIEKGTSIINNYIYNNERMSKSNKNEFKSGDVLYGKLRPYLKKILVAPLDGVCTTEIFPFVGYGGISSHYIAMIMKSTYFDTIVNDVTHGMNMPRLGTNTATNIPFPLPPLSEQHRIVQKVDELFALLDNLNSEVKSSTNLLAMLKNKTLDLAIQGKLVLQDESDGTAHELLKKIKAEKEKLIREKKIKKQETLSPVAEEEIPFEIPDNWCWARLGEIGITQTGTTPDTRTSSYYSGKIPFVKPNDIFSDRINYNTDLKLTEAGLEKSRCVKMNSLLMVCIGTIGKANVTRMECAINQQINSLTPVIHEMNSMLLLYFAQSQYYQNLIIDGASSTTIPIINKTKWENTILPLPPLAEQHRIVKKVDSIMSLIQEMEEDLNRKTVSVMNAVLNKREISDISFHEDLFKTE
jgi:type I restriction enzyme S subunit